MKATDLFTGVIHLFVIFLPGGILLVGVLFAVYPQVLTYDIGTLGFLGILGASYVIGHFLSLIAAQKEDKRDFDQEEVNFEERQELAKTIAGAFQRREPEWGALPADIRRFT